MISNFMTFRDFETFVIHNVPFAPLRRFDLLLTTQLIPEPSSNNRQVQSIHHASTNCPHHPRRQKAHRDGDHGSRLRRFRRRLGLSGRELAPPSKVRRSEVYLPKCANDSHHRCMCPSPTSISIPQYTNST